MSYVIGSGWHDPANQHSDWHEVWLDNTVKTSRPEMIFVIGDSGSFEPWSYKNVSVDRTPRADYQFIKLTGDLGKYSKLLDGTKTHAFNGWTGGVLAGAMLAYCNESDFIYKESDCLAFGNWVGQLYAELGEGGIICGGPVNNPPVVMPCSQSLFLVRHWFIPEFVGAFLTSPGQRSHDQLGEAKFAAWMRQNPSKWRQMSFGYDRNRPFNVADPVFYVQQVTPDELNVLREAALL